MAYTESQMDQDFVVADRYLDVVGEDGRFVAACYYALPRRGLYFYQVHYVLRAADGGAQVFDVTYPLDGDATTARVSWYEDDEYCYLDEDFDPADMEATLSTVMRDFIHDYYSYQDMTVRTTVQVRKER